jgi:hypothetical protein
MTILPKRAFKTHGFLHCLRLIISRALAGASDYYAKVAKALALMPTSPDTVESEGWQMKQC